MIFLGEVIGVRYAGAEEVAFATEVEIFHAASDEAAKEHMRQKTSKHVGFTFIEPRVMEVSLEILSNLLQEGGPYHPARMTAERRMARESLAKTGDSRTTVFSMEQHVDQVKSQLRQVTLEEIRESDQWEGVLRLVVEAQVLPKSAARIDTWYLDFGKVILERVSRKRKPPLIKNLKTHLLGLDWEFTEKYVEQMRSIRYAGDDGTFFIDCGPVYLLQMFREDGQGRLLSEVEALAWYDAAHRRRYITEARYHQKVSEVVQGGA